MRERYARLCNRTTPHSGGVAQPNSNNQENVSLKKDEEGADQDPGSDDDMEDEDIMEDEDVENEEEEGDESSEYQPTVVPTDLDDAEVSEDDDLMEQEDTSEHCGQGQFAFLELPREIRDKVKQPKSSSPPYHVWFILICTFRSTDLW